MTSQDIFKAIISDDNVGLLESVNTVLYEKSNLLVEDYKIVVAQNIMSENDEYGDDGYRKGKNVVYKTASSDKATRDAELARHKHNSELESLINNTQKQRREHPETTGDYRRMQASKKLDIASKLKNETPEDRSKHAERLMKKSQRREGINGSHVTQQRLEDLKNKTREFDNARLDAGKVNPKGIGRYASVVTAQKNSNAKRSSLKLDQPYANRRVQDEE
jgi:hypothetical protein